MTASRRHGIFAAALALACTGGDALANDDAAATNGLAQLDISTLDAQRIATWGEAELSSVRALQAQVLRHLQQARSASESLGLGTDNALVPQSAPEQGQRRLRLLGRREPSVVAPAPPATIPEPEVIEKARVALYGLVEHGGAANQSLEAALLAIETRADELDALAGRPDVSGRQAALLKRRAEELRRYRIAGDQHLQAGRLIDELVATGLDRVQELGPAVPTKAQLHDRIPEQPAR